MLAVVENDAQEVEDVILEIRERLSEMEAQLEQLQAHSQAIRLRHKLLGRVLNLLRTLGGNLPVFISAAKLYGNNWSVLKETLIAKAEELASLTDFCKRSTADMPSRTRCSVLLTRLAVKSNHYTRKTLLCAKTLSEELGNSCHEIFGLV